MEQRFQYLDGYAQRFLLEQKKKLYCGHITDVTMGFESYQKVPQGAWQKGSDTTVLMEFFEHFCSEHADIVAQHDILRWVHTALANINLAIRLLYKSGLWLTKDQARTIGVSGLNFLKSYSYLVSLTLRAGRDRFPITPKCHFIHHLFYNLKADSARLTWSLNCLSTAVQMDEELSYIQSKFF